MTAQADVIVVDITGRDVGFEDALNRAEASAEGAGQRTGSRFGSALKVGLGVAAAGAAVVTGALLAGGTAAIAAATQVEEAMNTIRAGTGATGEALVALRGDFEAVAANVPEDLGTVSKVLADLNTRTGATGEGLQSLTTQMLELARVSGDDVNSLVASTTRLFGDWSIATEDQADTLDKLWKVSQTTGIGVDQLAQKVTQFGAPLRQMGFSFEESTALLGKFEKEGVNGELVMSSLRIALGQTAKESEKLGKYQEEATEIQAKLTKEVKKNGDETVLATKLKGKLAEAEDKINFALSSSDAPKALRERFELIKSLGSVSERNAAAMELFGAKAGPDMAAAIYEGRFEIDELLKTLDTSDETIKKAADDTKTLAQSYAEIKNGVTLALAPLGELAINGIKPLVPLISNAVAAGSLWIKNLAESGKVQAAVKDGLTTLQGAYNTAKNVYAQVSAQVEKLSAFFERNKEVLLPLVAGITAGTAAYGLYRTALIVGAAAQAAWTTATTIATTASVAFRAAITFLTGPVGIAITVITALVAAGVYLYRNWDEIKAKAIAIWGRIREVVQEAMGGALAFLKTVPGKMGQVALDIIQGLLNGIQQGPRLILNAVKGLGNSIISGVKGVLGIKSPSTVMFSAGENVGQGLSNGITKTTPQVQKAASGLSKAVISEVDKARAALEKDIRSDAWVASLKNATAAQLTSAQAIARASGDAQKYGVIKTELARRQDAVTAATNRATDAAKAEADQLRKNRESIVQSEQQERYIQGLNSATDAQLASARATAKAGGEVDKYNLIKGEQTRREDESRKATEASIELAKRVADGIRQAAEQIASNRKAITDALQFGVYVEGLKGYSDELLVTAARNAMAAGDGQKFNVVLAEQTSRADSAAKAISDLADAQIKAANSRYADTQGANDSAVRLTNGAGDVGLIRSLAAATGFTVGQIRADVQAALDDARTYAPETARIIERVYADALAHRKSVAAEQAQVTEQSAKDEEERIQRVLAAHIAAAEARRLVLEADAAEDQRINNAINESAAVQSANRIRLIKDQDDAQERAMPNFVEMNAELARQKLPMTDLIALAEDYAKGTDKAAGAARAWLETLKGVEVQARATAQAVEPVEARRVAVYELMPEEPTAAGPAAPDLLGGKVDAGLGAEVDAAANLIAYRAEIKGLTDDELELAKADAVAAGERGKFNALVAEGTERAKVAADSTKLLTQAEGELHTLLTGETLPAYELKAQALEAQAVLDEAQRVRLLQLADAIRAAGAAADANKEKLNITLHVAGIDTGLKALDLYKSAIQGVGSVISKTFEDMVAGTGSGVNSILQNMALMALGIVKQVAVAIVAYQAQAIALALISGASFNFVQAGLALAAAAAVAGIVAGLESRVRGSGASAPAVPSTGVSTAPGAVAPPPNNSLVSIPNSSVTVVAAPEWTAVMARAADKIDRAADKLLDFSDRPMRIQSTVRVEGGQSGGLGAFALTTP